MALIDVAEMTELTNRLGASEADLQAALDDGDTNSAMGRLMAARDYTYDAGGSLNGTSFDNILTLATALRGCERTLKSNSEASLSAGVSALDAYALAETSKTFRAYYDGKETETTIAWNDDFRGLWRRLKSEELVIKLSDSLKTAGTWATTLTDPAIELASKMELRAATTIGAADVVVTLTLTTSADTSVNIGVLIPAGTAAGTAVQVKNSTYTTFKAVTAVAVTGGTNADSVEVWVMI
jgi:hypothetical protein